MKKMYCNTDLKVFVSKIDIIEHVDMLVKSLLDNLMDFDLEPQR